MASLYQQAKQHTQRAINRIEDAQSHIAGMHEHYQHTDESLAESLLAINTSCEIVKEQLRHFDLMLRGQIQRYDMIDNGGDAGANADGDNHEGHESTGD